MRAYLDSNGLVLATSRKGAELAEVQQMQPTAVLMLEDVPPTLRHQYKPVHHHRWLGTGDGTSLDDYEEVASPLTEGQRDSLAAVHDYVPRGSARLNYRAINYRTGIDRRLFKRTEKDRGEVTRIVHYADEERTVPVVEERFTTHYDIMGLHDYRMQEIQWYDRAGALIEGAIQRDKKPYEGLEKIEASERRRSNVNKELQITVLGMMSATMGGDPLVVLETGRAFMLAHRDSLLRWVDSDDPTVRQEVIDATDTWLDNVIDADGTTIRDHMLYELSDP